MKSQPGFKVFQKDGVTGFENTTNMNLWISVKPIKPKRKYVDIIMIPPKSFKLFTETEIDLTKIIFTLEKACAM